MPDMQRSGYLGTGSLRGLRLHKGAQPPAAFKRWQKTGTSGLSLKLSFDFKLGSVFIFDRQNKSSPHCNNTYIYQLQTPYISL